MIRTIIIDDEKRARETIGSILKLYCPNVQVVAEAENVESAVQLINRHKPDLVLLDINMPGETGFDLFTHFSTIDFKIIFITAHQEYAVKAFKFSALDYILKPFNPDELIEAINRSQALIEKENIKIKLDSFISNMGNKAGETKKIVLKTNDSIHVINIQDIIRCEADGNYTKFYIIGGKKIHVSTTLKEYEDLLLPYKFFRTHQSHLANINQIERYEKKDGGYLIMKDGASVPVSVRKKELLLIELEKI